MAQSSPTSLFNTFHNVVDVCATVNFFIDKTLFLVDSEDSTKTTSLEASEPALNLLTGFPYRGGEWTLDLYIWSLVFVCRAGDFQMFCNLLKACAARPVLVGTSMAMPLSADM